MNMNSYLVEDPKTIQLNAAALSDRGRMRKTNEDSVYQITETTTTGDSIGFYIVCDGMGGQEAGDVASQLALATIVSAVEENLLYGGSDSSFEAPLLTSPTMFFAFLVGTILQANTAIRDFINGSSISKMGTTVNAMIVFNDRAYIANVGDCRTYHWREGKVKQLTSDHSLANEMAQQNIIALEDVHAHQMRNILTRSLGSKEKLDSEEIDTYEQDLRPGDKLLLCSDGLWQAFPDCEDLAAHMDRMDHPQDLCWRLIEVANQRDGSDNISAVAVFVT